MDRNSAQSAACIRFGGGSKPISEIMFKKYDLNNDGSISYSELRSLCYDLGYYLSDDELNWARILIDKDGSGMIDCREFADWWKTSSRFEHLKMPDEKQAYIICRVAEISRSYDTTNIGSLDKLQFAALKEELIREGILDQNRYQASEFDEIDLGRDGRINFNEMIAWLKNIQCI